MRELNTDYLGTVTVGTDGYWYNNRNDQKERSMPETTLNALAQSMIETVEWNLGSPNNNNGVYDTNWEDNLTPIYSYAGERADTSGKVCNSGPTCNDEVARTSTWTGKVGLVYPSDYGYATSGGTTTNKTTCLSTSMNHWDLTENEDCKNNNWMIDKISNQWTITPLTFQNDARYALRINYTGNVLGRSTDTERAIRPTVFLQTSVRIVSGEGTKNSPYKLVM